VIKLGVSLAVLSGNFVGSRVTSNIGAGAQAAMFFCYRSAAKRVGTASFSWLEPGLTLSGARAAAATISTHLSCLAAIASSR
jgi:hypothetical protein